MRTTIDLDPTVLHELKARSRAAGRSLGSITSELLAPVLARSEPAEPASPLTLVCKPMQARVDLDDAETVRRALDAES
jgi:hypothetical protein